MRMALFGGIALLIALVLSTSSTAQTCIVSTVYGWQADADCDGVPNDYDNCPQTPNAFQTDLNRNLIGDSCDLLIEQVFVEPDNRLKQGDFVRLVVRILNNRDGPITDAQIKVTHEGLKMDAMNAVPMVPAGESTAVEFWLKVPKCAKTGSHDLTVSSSFREPYTHRLVSEVQTQRIFVTQNDVCESRDGPLDNTIINVFGRVDVDRNDDVLIPITITNRGQNQATYHLTVSDLSDWGSWRIDPAASIVVPPDHEGDLFLYLQTEQDTPPGTREVQLMFTAGKQRTVVPVDVFVRAPLERAMTLGTFIVEAVLILLLMLLVGILGILALLHLNKRHRKEMERPVVKAEVKRAKKRKKVAVEKVKKGKRETYY